MNNLVFGNKLEKWIKLGVPCKTKHIYCIDQT